MINKVYSRVIIDVDTRDLHYYGHRLESNILVRSSHISWTSERINSKVAKLLMYY
jgi:hypothetical protein